MKEWRTPFQALEIGKGRCLIQGKDLAIISIGTAGQLAKRAISKATDYSVALYDMRFLKPLDEELLHQIFQNFSRIITVEDGTIQGGLGSAEADYTRQRD